MKPNLNIIDLSSEQQQFLQYCQEQQFSVIGENYENGKWYRLPDIGLLCSDGTPYHANIKIGTENNIAVIFCGGGGSFNEYTAARPFRFSHTPMDGFYFANAELFPDVSLHDSIGDSREFNPFRNWSAIFISYASADFHIGTGDFRYTDLNGKAAVLHHHGYTNFRAVMEQAVRYLPSLTPEKLLITGASAGGYAAAVLAKDTMAFFPECHDVTVYADSALVTTSSMKEIVKDIWKAPAHIVKIVKSDNITTDAMLSLYQNYGDKIKYLISNSTKDIVLSTYQSYLDGNGMRLTESGGDHYYSNLKKMHRTLKDNIPSIAFYIHSTPAEPNNDNSYTKHCINQMDNDGRDNLTWLWNAVNGNLTCVGEELLI